MERSWVLVQEEREMPVMPQLLQPLPNHNSSQNCSAKSSQISDPQKQWEIIKWLFLIEATKGCFVTQQQVIAMVLNKSYGLPLFFTTKLRNHPQLCRFWNVVLFDCTENESASQGGTLTKRGHRGLTDVRPRMPTYYHNRIARGLNLPSSGQIVSFT